MSEKKKQTSNKKKIYLIIAVLAVLIVVVILALCIGHRDADQKQSGENAVGATKLQKNDESTQTDELLTIELIETSTAPDEEPWENVSIIQDNQSDNYMRDDQGNPVTDENGEIVTESYPGEAQGWSPLVPADEVGTK